MIPWWMYSHVRIMNASLRTIETSIHFSCRSPNLKKFNKNDPLSAVWSAHSAMSLSLQVCRTYHGVVGVMRRLLSKSRNDRVETKSESRRRHMLEPDAASTPDCRSIEMSICCDITILLVSQDAHMKAALSFPID